MTIGILTKLIDESLTIKTNEDDDRDYIGASSIGHPCERKIWYEFNKESKEPYSKKQLRTFAIGKKLESIVIDCLRDAGTHIKSDIDCDFFDGTIGLFKGHVDALWIDDSNNVKAIIEIKTARDSSFNIFVKKGLREWQPVYFAQIQSYMGMSGIHEGFVVALNKDTSAIHDEQVFFDEYYYDSLKQKALRIINAKEPLARINNDPLYFMCRMCQFKGVCHQ